MKDIVRRVGQRFMVGFEGLTASADVKALIREFGVAHVVLFARNVEEPVQLAELVRELQSVARDAGLSWPLLVAVDQEGGRVARLKEPWTVWPAPRALGRAGDEEMARQTGEALAAELGSCGIRMNVAPVVDVDTNPDNPVIGDRSFGDDPVLVGRLGVAMIRALQAGGVAACAKHFPGHGDTDVDSHLDLPVLSHPRSRLDEVELPPFRRAIEAEVATVLTSHVLFPEVDEALPASLSEPLTTGLLRGELGFDAVVLTDDLDMKAVAHRWTPAEIAAKAAGAGADILAFCRDHDAQVEGIEALIRTAESGEMPFTAMEAAERRVRRLQEQFLGGYRDPDPREARQVAGRAEHRELAERIAAAAGLSA
jgi:beta-N-acetylhexosaminidase